MLGYNYRMTDLQAALGLLAAQAARRACIAAASHSPSATTRCSPACRCACPPRLPDRVSAWHLYAVEVDEQRSARHRGEVFERCATPASASTCTTSRSTCSRTTARLGFRRGDFPVAEAYYGGPSTLPLFPDHEPTTQQARVVAADPARGVDGAAHEAGGHSGARRQQAHPAQEHPAVRRQADDRLRDRGGARQRRCSTAWSSPPTMPRSPRWRTPLGAEVPFLRPGRAGRRPHAHGAGGRARDSRLPRAGLARSIRCAASIPAFPS